jgi:hypothetical protein
MISLPDQISGGAGKGKTLEEQEGKIGNFQQNGEEELGTFGEEGEDRRSMKIEGRNRGTLQEGKRRNRNF